MDIKAEKLELVRLLLDTNNEQLLKKIKGLLTREVSTKELDWWDELPQQVQQRVIAAEKEIEAGQGVPHEQVLAKYVSRLKRA